MKFLFQTLILSITLSSCAKEDGLVNSNTNVNVTYSSTGTVTVNVKAKDGSNFNGAFVRLVSKDPDLNNYGVIQSGETDENGLYNSGQLLSGIYECNVNASDGEFVYMETKIFQITSDYNRSIKISPFENLCEVTLFIKDDDFNNGYPPVANVNVGIFEGYYYDYNNYSLNSLLNEVKFTGTSDAVGKVSFANIPSANSGAREYTAVVYNNEGDFHLSGLAVYGSAVTREIYVELD